MTKIAVVEANQQDAALLSELGAQTFVDTFGDLYQAADLQRFLSESHSPEAYRRLLGNPANRAFLARRGLEPMGYAVTGPCKLPLDPPVNNAGELQRIYVRQAAQNQGVGSLLFHACLQDLRQRFDAVFLGVFSENTGAHRFYQRNGFVKVGEYVFMVGDHADREWIMEWRGASVSQ